MQEAKIHTIDTFDDFSEINAAIRKEDKGEGVLVVNQHSDQIWNGIYFVEPESPALKFSGKKTDKTDERSLKIRVIPYEAGLPINFYVAVFPTVTEIIYVEEVLVYVPDGSINFYYLGTSNLWQPTEAEYAVIKRFGKTVGDHLRQTKDYNGIFHVQGILCDQYFNPCIIQEYITYQRYERAFFTDYQFFLLDLMLRNKVHIGMSPENIKSRVVESCDADRSLRCKVPAGCMHLLGLKSFMMNWSLSQYRLQLALDTRGGGVLITNAEKADVIVCLQPRTQNLTMHASSKSEDVYGGKIAKAFSFVQSLLKTH
eukprot:CAMPEP_0183816988 /NCGR_PEP_ID=MMETSP0803_2-20130417/59620_1 /TAXON_ID=195967 /ORGANISM="Crustomastix stigmata, Strain CCMP3273" /LENGTH=312 /DNA_ID=CAMNT_0026061873 /DNA_START=163 /DNA_END=1098 /DNA_ORIENTATION=+